MSRYTRIDPYVLEELKHRYQNSDANGRIYLLRNLHKNYGSPPLDIALLAVEDPHIEIRQWFAQHGKLDNHLIDRLKTEPNAFIRACIFENPNFFFPNATYEGGNDKLLHLWSTTTHLEHLAMVRNTRVSGQLIRKLSSVLKVRC